MKPRTQSARNKQQVHVGWYFTTRQKKGDTNMSMLEHIIADLKPLRYPANFSSIVKRVGDTNGDMPIKFINVYCEDFDPADDRELAEEAGLYKNDPDRFLPNKYPYYGELRSLLTKDGFVEGYFVGEVAYPTKGDPENGYDIESDLCFMKKDGSFWRAVEENDAWWLVGIEEIGGRVFRYRNIDIDAPIVEHYNGGINLDENNPIAEITETDELPF